MAGSGRWASTPRERAGRWRERERLSTDSVRAGPAAGEMIEAGRGTRGGGRGRRIRGDSVARAAVVAGASWSSKDDELPSP